MVRSVPKSAQICNAAFYPHRPKIYTVSISAGEQATMFFLDPSGNALEIKAMRDPAKLFAK